MKKLFPLFLVAMFLCWSLAVADITQSSREHNILTTNTAPAEEYIEADVSHMRPIESFVGTDNIWFDGSGYPPVVLEDTTLLFCPDTSMFNHPVHLPDDGWSAATSDNGTTENYKVWENYAISGEICDIHWWGFMLYFTGTSWDECYETAAFDIIFYPDNGQGMPDTANPVCTYLGVVPTQDTTGFRYHSTLQLPLWRFDVENLTPCCTLQSGWVSIQGVSPSTPDCWLLWQSSGTGDGVSWQWDGTAMVNTGYDRGLCLTGPAGDALGACCNDNNGQCVDSTLLVDCPVSVPGVRWAANTLCADLQPPCGTVFGACCDDQGNCTQTAEQDCPGLWLEATPCDPNPCPAPPPCTLVCPTNGIPEGEPDCYEDYDDITNGGCNSDIPVFSTINIGDTICGTAGTFVWHDTSGTPFNRRDTDWYRLTVTTDNMLYFYGIAEFNLQLIIMDAGSEDCVDYIQGPGISVEACSTAVVSWQVCPGVYWLWAGPDDFTGVACGSDYQIWTELGPPPTGACCVGTDCVATNTMCECEALQGNWYIGEDCATFQCPILVNCDDAVWMNGLPTGFARATQCDPLYPMQAGVADDFIFAGSDSIPHLDYVIAWFDHWNATPAATPADYISVNVAIYANDTNFSPPRPGGKPIDGDPDCSHMELIPNGIVYFVSLAQGSFGYVDDGNAWRLMLPVDVTLECETVYWVEVQPELIFSTHGQSGWVNTDITQGECGVQIFELLGDSVWHCLDDTTDLAFCLLGTGCGGGGCDYVAGDVNGSDSYNGLDVTYGVAFFKGGPDPMCPFGTCPIPPCDAFFYCGDVNNSCSYNGLDITYGVAYFKGGPGPMPCVDCPPTP